MIWKIKYLEDIPQIQMNRGTTVYNCALVEVGGELFAIHPIYNEIQRLRKMSDSEIVDLIIIDLKN